MYKYLSIILSTFLLIGGAFYLYEHYQNKKLQSELQQQLVSLEQVLQETKTAYSARGVELDNLKTTNKELERTIKQRNEDILALGKVVLEWKDKYYKVLNAVETTTQDGRIRVDFKQEQDGLEVSGFTLTSPAYAELKLHWTRPLVFNFILAKAKGGFYRLYVDPNDPTVIPTEINLQFDQSVFNKWYERLSASTQVAIGQGLLTSLGASYDVLHNLSVGPQASFYYDGAGLRKMYGVNLNWYIFKRE